jgi:hypothetical protein
LVVSLIGQAVWDFTSPGTSRKSAGSPGVLPAIVVFARGLCCCCRRLLYLFLRATSTSVVARGYYCCFPRLLVFLPATIVLVFACGYYCLRSSLQLELPAAIYAAACGYSCFIQWLLPFTAAILSAGGDFVARSCCACWRLALVVGLVRR